MTNNPPARNPPLAAWLGRVGGPLAALAVYGLMSVWPDGLTAAGRATAAIGALMAVWWMTEAWPLPVTALLPLILFPLAQVLPIQQAAAPYANPLIFLFLGGFLIAMAIERWGLHRRIALLTILMVGTRPTRLVGGFMLATAALSMWISNTATTLMMLPIGLSVVRLLTDRLRSEGIAEGAAGPASVKLAETSTFAVCLMLGIAYAANIGGLGTLIGTPPNLFLAGFLSDRYGITIGFGQWMALAVPLVTVFLLLAWLLLTRVLFPIHLQEVAGGRELIRGEFHKLGRVSRGEWTVLAVFLMTASLWVLREPLAHWQWLAEQLPAVRRLDDTLIALIGAVALFMIPVDARRGVFALDWQTAQRLPWGLLLLFGGGLSLATAVTSSGLDQWIGMQLEGLRPLPPLLLVVAITAVVIFLTEVTSNTATATALLPILAALAVAIDPDLLLLITIPAALAASCAFMLPVATPPNAIVFGSGHVTLRQMLRAGFWLNLLAVLLIPALMYLWRAAGGG